MTKITDPAEYQKVFLTIKNEVLARWQENKIKDKSLEFLGTIENINKLSFVVTTGSCSSHIENPLPDPAGHIHKSRKHKPVPSVVLKDNLLTAPEDKFLVIFGYVGLELNKTNKLAKAFIDECEQLLKNYSNAEITGKGDIFFDDRGIEMWSITLRFWPWPNLAFSGYARYDFYEIYLVDKEQGVVLREMFDDFWKKLNELAIKFQELDKKYLKLK